VIGNQVRRGHRAARWLCATAFGLIAGGAICGQSISVDDVVVDEGAGTAVFTVSLDAASAQTITVEYATVDGTAFSPADFDALSTTLLTFDPDETSKQVTVTLADDALDEPDEGFTVELSNPSNATIADGTGAATITDNDAAPTVEFTAASQTASELDGTITVTASLSAVSGQDVTVPFTLSGSAVPPADYTITASPVTILAGQTSAAITITLNDDASDEADETVIVTMGTPVNAAPGAVTGHTATITDNDAAPMVEFTAAAQTASEGDGTITVTASLSAVSGQDVTVPFTLSGSAVSPADYTITASPVTILAGQTSAAITITLNDDTSDEPDDTVIVTMGTPVNADPGSVTEHTATVTDNDAPPTISISDVAVGEGDGTAQVTVSLSEPSGHTVTVEHTTQDGTALDGSDYTGNPTTVLTLDPGETTGQVVVAILEDSLDEADEVFTVELSNPSNATILDGSAAVTITDNESVPSVDFTAAAQAGSEGDGTLTVTVTLSAVSGLDVTVPYTLSGSAVSPADYTVSPNPVTILAGQITAAITITLADDALDEAAETIVLTIGTPTNAAPGSVTVHTATVADNDAAPAVEFTAAAQTASEGDGTITVTASLSAVSGQDVTVPYMLSGSAVSPADYTITASPVTILAGQTSAAITITLNDDASDEPDETVIVTMGTPVNATPGAVTVHTATITDNDGPPAVDFTAASQTSSEGGGPLTVTASIAVVSANDITVPFTVSGIAVSPADYTITPSPITIFAGQTSAVITITLNDDALDEADETVIVTMGTPVNGVQGTVTVHTATITDNDAVPSVAFTTATQSGAESVGTLSATLQLSAVSGRDVSIPFTLSGSAVSPADYTITPSPVTILAGQTSTTLVLAVVDDALDEIDESAVITLGAPVNAVLGTPSQHTATILDNDAPPTVQWNAASQPVTEAAGGVFVTAALSGPSGQTITVPFTVGGTASSPADYTITASPIVVNPGDTTGSAVISVVNDVNDEPDQTVVATMGTPTNAIASGTTVQTVTILDDDAPPGLSVNDVTVPESVGTAGFTVSLSPPSEKTVSVTVQTQNGSALAGQDYTATGPTVLTFTPGQTTKPFSVPILEDSVIESIESYTVLLSAPVDGTLADPAGLGFITDNDAFYPSDFGRYSELEIDSGDPVGQFYSVGFTIDTQAMVAQGFAKADGSDLAVAWDSTGNGTWIEIDAHLRPAVNLPLAASPNTQVWFAIAEPTGITSYPYAHRYRLYYNNPGAIAAVRRRNGKLVYRFFDDFNGTSVDSTVWYVHPSYAPAVSVSSGQLHMNGADSPGSVWQGAPIRITSQSASNVPTYSVNYLNPFAAETRFRSLITSDDVRPVTYLGHMPPPTFPNDHDEYPLFFRNNGALSARLIKVNNGIGSGLVTNGTAITAGQWYDAKVTVRLTVTTPGSERALHTAYLNGTSLGDSNAATRGGYDPTITSGIVGLTTDPGSKGDFDWVLYRDFKPNEPVLRTDPAVELRVRGGVASTEVYWISAGGALSYDVVRGNLANLSVTATTVTLGPVVCIENESPDLTTAPDHLDTGAPPAGQTFFYLLRVHTNVDVGNYGYSSKNQRRAPVVGDCP